MSTMQTPSAPLGPPSSRSTPPPRGGGSGCLGVAFTLSFILNLFLLGILGIGLLGLIGIAALGTGESVIPLREKVYSGSSTATNKVAVIKLEGPIMEGLLGFVNRQIDTAAEDSNVKAVVLRVESPGGSITASDDLHRRLTLLRDGNPEKKTTTAKPNLIVSMGNVAASGGYYISMPAKTLYAERTTMTGSIGVYAAFPNISELAKTYGVSMDIIKRGDVKASGSMFKKMRPEERQVWDDMIGHAYNQFIEVVETGRPTLKGKLLEPVIDEERTIKDEDGKDTKFHYVRRRADGGIYTSDEALKYDLIDKIGYLEDAIADVKKMAGLSDDCKVITYEKPFSLTDSFGAFQASESSSRLDLNRLASGLTPRIWYLAPGSEMAGFVAAAAR
jgi:protease-4